MERICSIIGEHTVWFVSNSDNLINSLRRSFPPVKDEGKLQPDLFIHIEEGYGVPFVDYHVEINKEAGKVTFRRADYLLEADSDYKHANLTVYDELALEHALINWYSSYVVYHNWGLIIHSSCVMDGGKAHIFAGQSGAGKSTAAKLSHPRELLSDEATLVKITPGSILVYNSPFRSELEMTGNRQSSPLTSVNLLVQAVQNQRMIIRKSNGFLQLMDKVFYWAHDPDETRRIIRLMKILTDTVPVYELHFQKNNSFWELIS
jgi:hypothetical protein